MTTMKKQGLHRTLRLSVLSLVVLAVLASCNLISKGGPTSISQCLSEFSSAYTAGNYGSLYTYWSQYATDYGAMKAATFWDTTQFASANSPQALSGYTTTGTTVTGPFVNANYGGSGQDKATIAFTMEQDGLYWYIRSYTIMDTTKATVVETIS